MRKQTLRYIGFGIPVLMIGLVGCGGGDPSSDPASLDPSGEVSEIAGSSEDAQSDDNEGAGTATPEPSDTDAALESDSADTEAPDDGQAGDDGEDDATEVPAENAEGDGDDTGDPADATEVPADATDVPADDSPEQADDTEIPTDDTPYPAEDSPVPEDDTSSPLDGTPSPLDDTPTPVDDGEAQQDDTGDQTSDPSLNLDQDGDGLTPAEGDCDDLNAEVRPGIAEICDGFDNDCNGEADDGVKTTYFWDGDADGFGNSDLSIEGCEGPIGYVQTDGDCDDAMWSVNPEGVELCNGVDDDCDGLLDAEDDFEVENGYLAVFSEDCDSYEILTLVELPELKLSYQLRGLSDSFTIRDGIFIGAHVGGIEKPAGWPEGCTFIDEGYYWYDMSNPAYNYAMKACFSAGTDSEGGDEVYLELTYNGMTIEGVFNTESDSDASEYDEVFLSESESSEREEFWYISDTVTVSGSGYTGTVLLEGARGRLGMND